MRKHIAFCLGDTDFDIVVGGTDASYIAPNSMGLGHPVHERAIRKRVKREEEGWRN